jgi:periplasmic protein CpxP/Spy
MLLAIWVFVLVLRLLGLIKRYKMVVGNAADREERVTKTDTGCGNGRLAGRPASYRTEKITGRNLMKRIIGRFTYTATITFAAVLFCMTIIFGSPLVSRAETGGEPKMRDVEARINDVHSKLKITEAQEEQWNKVAQVMRDNAATMEPLIKARKAQINTMNAVEDLKSYAKISDAHTAGLNNFILVFEPLYTGMSDEQKKIADKIFTKHDHHKRSKKK